MKFRSPPCSPFQVFWKVLKIYNAALDLQVRSWETLEIAPSKAPENSFDPLKIIPPKMAPVLQLSGES
jgi:hypothetical protein